MLFMYVWEKLLWEIDFILYIINHQNINESVSLQFSSDKKNPEESWNSGGDS